MAYGLQVFDKSGNEIVGPDIPMSFILGTFKTGTSNGSHTDSKLTSSGMGEGFALPINSGSGYSSSAQAYGPKFTISGDKISWDFEDLPSDMRMNVTVLYGTCGL